MTPYRDDNLPLNRLSADARVAEEDAQADDVHPASGQEPDTFANFHILDRRSVMRIAAPWWMLFESSTEHNKSPINITSGDKQVIQFETFMTFVPYHSRLSTVVTADRGWRMEEERTGPILTGGPFQAHLFKLHHIECYWGHEDFMGSLHTVDGKNYAGEVRFVYWNKSDFQTYEEASSSDDGLVVVAVFLEAGAINIEVEKVARALLSGEKKKARVEDFNVYGLFPKCTRSFMYAGSYKNEFNDEETSVTCVVLQQPVEVCRSQIEYLRRYQPVKTAALASGNLSHRYQLGDRDLFEIECHFCPRIYHLESANWFTNPLLEKSPFGHLSFNSSLSGDAKFNDTQSNHPPLSDLSSVESSFNNSRAEFKLFNQTSLKGHLINAQSDYSPSNSLTPRLVPPSGSEQTIEDIIGIAEMRPVSGSSPRRSTIGATTAGPAGGSPRIVRVASGFSVARSPRQMARGFFRTRGISRLITRGTRGFTMITRNSSCTALGLPQGVLLPRLGSRVTRVDQGSDVGRIGLSSRAARVDLGSSIACVDLSSRVDGDLGFPQVTDILARATGLSPRYATATIRASKSSSRMAQEVCGEREPTENLGHVRELSFRPHDAVGSETNATKRTRELLSWPPQQKKELVKRLKRDGADGDEYTNRDFRSGTLPPQQFRSAKVSASSFYDAIATAKESVIHAAVVGDSDTHCSQKKQRNCEEFMPSSQRDEELHSLSDTERKTRNRHVALEDSSPSSSPSSTEGQSPKTIRGTINCAMS